MTRNTKKSQNKKIYDVCIVGAGPAALSCLSAIREPYSLDNLTETQLQRAEKSLHLNNQLSVCVIDPKANWMQTWRTNFTQLRIQNLRSPSIANPDMFDRNALLAYAVRHGREHELKETGCFDMKDLVGLGQTQCGLWKLPSTKLFLDFCDDMTKRLSHSYIQGVVVDLVQDEKKVFRLDWVDPEKVTQKLSARNVVLATGMVGSPIIPRGLKGCHTVPWTSPKAFTKSSIKKKEHVLVIGGGLTAVQAALRVVDAGNTCILCSRRPLQEKHFDISVEWFDQRRANKCLSEFYHDSIENRLLRLKEARDGGSVPPLYMKRLDQKRDSLKCWVGDVEYRHDDDDINAADKDDDRILIHFQGSVHKFDKIVVACGIKPDCVAQPLIEKIHKQWPINVCGGLPDVTQDMRWHDGKTGNENVYVAGAMAGLQVGPDAGNLMGIRRAASVIADSLDCRTWLQEQVYFNKFDVLLFSDSESETESCCGSEAECFACCDDDDEEEIVI